MLTYALIAKQRMLRCGFSPPTNENFFKDITDDKRDETVRLLSTLRYHESIFALPTHETNPPQENENNKKAKPDALIGRFAPFGCNFSNIIFDVFRFV